MSEFNIHKLSPLFIPVDESTIGPEQQGDAQYFVQMFSRVLRYNVDSKKWLIWNGHYWSEDGGEDIGEFVQYMNDFRLKKAEELTGIKRRAIADTPEGNLIEKLRLETEYKAVSKHYGNMRKCRHSHYISGIIKLAQSHRIIKTKTAQWDKDPMLLATPNGVIELDKGVFRPGKQSDMISHGIPVVFDAAARCPRFEKFIEEVLEFPSEIDNIQKFLGYCISGSVKSQIVAFFLGEGSNGKSKLLDSLCEILGQDTGGFAWTMNMQSLSEKARDHIPADVAALVGKRVAIASEAGEGRAIDVVKLKMLSGEETISARKLYGNPINFTARMKIILNVNHLPEAKDSSNGYWRRCFIWNFPKNFEMEGAGKDLDLMEKLRTEYPGILNWLVAGAVKYFSEGLRQTPRQIEWTESYRADNDPLKPFIDETLIFGETTDKISISQLRALALEWNKTQKKFTDDMLAKRLIKAGCFKQQYGKDRAWHWFGVRQRGVLADL